MLILISFFNILKVLYDIFLHTKFHSESDKENFSLHVSLSWFLILFTLSFWYYQMIKMNQRFQLFKKIWDDDVDGFPQIGPIGESLGLEKNAWFKKDLA